MYDTTLKFQFKRTGLNRQVNKNIYVVVTIKAFKTHKCCKSSCFNQCWWLVTVPSPPIPYWPKGWSRCPGPYSTFGGPISAVPQNHPRKPYPEVLSEWAWAAKSLKNPLIKSNVHPPLKTFVLQLLCAN